MALSVQPLDPANYTQIQGGTNFYGPAAPTQQTAGDPITNDASGSTSSGSYSGGGSAAPVTDPNAVAYLDNEQNAANTALGRLDNQQNIGLGNINNGYQGSLNTLLGEKAIVDRNYGTAKDQTLQDNVQAKGNIDFGVGQHNNALQRLLASHGYSGSANLAASYSAARDGSLQRNQVSQTYGRNQQALDTNYGDYKNKYTDSVNDLGVQKTQQENSLRAQIDQNKTSLLSQLAAIAQQRGQVAGKTYAQTLADAQPYQNQINAINGQIDSLGAQPTYTPKQAVYNAPKLDAYNYDQTAAPQVGGQNGLSDSIAPYLNVLLGAEKKQQDNLNGV